MTYPLDNNKLQDLLLEAEQQIISSTPLKFIKSNSWRIENVPNTPGIYALFENTSDLIYIGETGNLRKRMSDLCRTVNHSFRKKLGAKRYGGVRSTKKFDDQVEGELDRFFDESLYAKFMSVNFGRLEIETYLVTKYQSQLLNSVKKRK